MKITNLTTLKISGLLNDLSKLDCELKIDIEYDIAVYADHISQDCITFSPNEWDEIYPRWKEWITLKHSHLAFYFKD